MTLKTESMDADVIVVGGGPIGLASAIEARLAGFTVIVIEPRDGTIDKACGEGLMPGALPLLERLGVRPVGLPFRGISYRDGHRVADHLFRRGFGLGVRRLALHDALTARAAELGVMRVRVRVQTYTEDADGVSVAGLRARWLFGVDGLHSTIRQVAGLDSQARGVHRYGLRRHFSIEPWNDLVEVHWSHSVEAYVTPVSPEVVGIAMLGKRGAVFSEALAAIPELRDRLADAEPASSLRGAGPLRQRAKRPGIGRVLLIGDASGYIDAITGEGVRLGLEQARVAVQSIAEDAPRAYDAEWRRVTRNFRVLTSGLVAAAGSPLRRGIVPLAAARPAAYGAIVERLAR